MATAVVAPSQLNNPTQPPPPAANEIHTVGPFILGKTLGTGATGKVKLGFHKETGFKVAVKIISKEMLSTRPSMRKKVEREIVVMKVVDHPNVLRLFDVYETSRYLFLILEYVEGGELFDYLINKGTLEPAEALHFFQQLIRGLDHCHTHIICHRDLKPENLLLDAERNIKIADFGMATLMRKGSLLSTSCGSPHYASPEVVMGLKYAGTGADIWSCGVILYALLTGKLPFDDDNIRKLLSKVKAGVFTMPQFLHKDAQDLITRMLTADPAKRITMAEVKAHPWYNMDRLRLSTSLPLLEPALEELPGDPLPDVSQIDDDIFRSLRALGWGTDQEIQAQLLADQPSTVTVFYRLLEARKRNPEFNLTMQAQAARGPRALARARSGERRGRSMSSSDNVKSSPPPPSTPPSPLREIKRERGNSTGTAKSQGLLQTGPAPGFPSQHSGELMFPLSPSHTPPEPFQLNGPDQTIPSGPPSPTISPPHLPVSSLTASLMSSGFPAPTPAPASPPSTPPGSPRSGRAHAPSLSPTWSRTPSSPLSTGISLPSPSGSPRTAPSSSVGAPTSPINIASRFRRIKLSAEASSPAGSPIIGSSPKRSWFSNFFSGSPKPTRPAVSLHSRKSGQVLLDELQRVLDVLRISWRELEPTTYKAQYLSPEGSIIKFTVEILDAGRGPLGPLLDDSSSSKHTGSTIINLCHRGGSPEQFNTLCSKIENECDL
eukprot:TRINITY_DN4177_c0_g1_i1.p1 TRINITY_DN4177_c0_g1~~TRINITY_DN4177_c0_g1_i1.p1  ORF type:complete len:718 (+),score=162.91 TRINITY_DN4177_c0_g1_i1:287-2440(+)